jgi:hypothetical protein
MTNNQTTRTREDYVAAVMSAKSSLKFAEEELATFDQAPENNRFDSLEDALGTIQETLYERAHDDCEGSYSFGDDQYSQKFYVGEDLYEAILYVEYNRHDKTYYYVEETEFEYKKL